MLLHPEDDTQTLDITYLKYRDLGFSNEDILRAYAITKDEKIPNNVKELIIGVMINYALLNVETMKLQACDDYSELVVRYPFIAQIVQSTQTEPNTTTKDSPLPTALSGQGTDKN